MPELTESDPNKAVAQFWNSAPCGTRELQEPFGSSEFFKRLAIERDQREPFIPSFARFDEQKGKRVLEVGVGAGSDFIRFVRAGAIATGVDLTANGIALVRKRLGYENLWAELQVANAESLPYADASFDYVYSWGVIHHSNDTARCAQEIMRVLKPGGSVCVMIYHLHSLVALQAYLLYGLLRGRPLRPLREIIAAHIESPGTKAFTREEARRLFTGLSDLRVTSVVTPYDLRYTRSRHLPLCLRHVVPSALGWFLVVQGKKPLA
ncbi:MAG TPA: class I SAM-dependent methyltransferase [Planctomycetota bacterium]|nr:class I SAM-dependent methyltransferase [Planctomycetota bacterium]